MEDITLKINGTIYTFRFSEYESTVTTEDLTALLEEIGKAISED